MGHERALLCSNPSVGPRAVIAVHSTVLGPGLGECRMWPFESDEEAMIDALRLSRGMTYKAQLQPGSRHADDPRDLSQSRPRLPIIG